MPCDINKYVAAWLDIVEQGKHETCEDQKLLAAYVRRCFATEDIYIDEAQLEKYIGLAKYFPYERLFEWEAFCIALHLCTFWKKDNRPRWPDLFLLIGRGAGKDGYIALESLCLTSPYNPIRAYDVDICATAEDVAMRPVNDIIGVLDDTQHRAKMKKHYYWTKEQVKGLKWQGVIRGRTNNPKSKDGMRSGMVVFNELHQYENYANIKVFVTGLGKKPHPRRLYATTNGDVREGPLDDLLKKSEDILRGDIGDNGLLPFICRLDDKAEASDKDKWVKANPSLPYLLELTTTIEKEYIDWKSNPIANADFMTKRMNRPQSDAEVAVTEWENIVATNRELPDLTGWKCVCGIDYASTTDMTSVNLHFRRGDERYDINHSWLCLQSRDLPRINAPWREWAEAGLITLVDDASIHPDIVCAWIESMGGKYIIEKVAMDNFRHILFSLSLSKIGFDHDRKNIHLVKPNDIMKTHPVIEAAFVNHNFAWGDNPVLRWATRNTKLVRSGAKGGADTGNFYYAKIEGKSRKTDPFMALVASMVIEGELGDGRSQYDDLPVIIC